MSRVISEANVQFTMLELADLSHIYIRPEDRFRFQRVVLRLDLIAPWIHAAGYENTVPARFIVHSPDSPAGPVCPDCPNYMTCRIQRPVSLKCNRCSQRWLGLDVKPNITKDIDYSYRHAVTWVRGRKRCTSPALPVKACPACTFDKMATAIRNAFRTVYRLQDILRDDIQIIHNWGHQRGVKELQDAAAVRVWPSVPGVRGYALVNDLFRNRSESDVVPTGWADIWFVRKGEWLWVPSSPSQS